MHANATITTCGHTSFVGTCSHCQRIKAAKLKAQEALCAKLAKKWEAARRS